MIGKITKQIGAIFERPLVLVVLAVLLIEAIFVVAPAYMPGFQPASVLVSALGALTNQERQNDNLPALAVNPLLSEAAQLKANDMVTKGYFAHTSPEGKTPWYWLAEVGYQYNYAGENLAVNFIESQDVTAAWMKSPTHRANIVKGAYTEMGSAIATGTYKGKESVFVVQIYANPVTVVPPVSKSSSSTVAVVSGKAAAGEVLGTSTEESATSTSAISFVVKKFSELRQEIRRAGMGVDGHDTENTILLVILCLSIVISLATIFERFGMKHQNIITNISILITIVATLWLVNINFFREGPMTTHVDYSETEAH